MGADSFAVAGTLTSVSGGDAMRLADPKSSGETRTRVPGFKSLSVTGLPSRVISVPALTRKVDAVPGAPLTARVPATRLTCCTFPIMDWANEVSATVTARKNTRNWTAFITDAAVLCAHLARMAAALYVQLGERFLQGCFDGCHFFVAHVIGLQCLLG